MIETCRKVSRANWFSNFILLVICLAAVVVGMQTYKAFELKHRVILDVLDFIVLGIFILEAVIKIVAEGKKPLNYFKEPWNIFDFLIV